METKEIVKIAMAKRNVNGVMELVSLTGLSYEICNRALKNDNSIKLKYLVQILDVLGYKLKATEVM